MRLSFVSATLLVGLALSFCGSTLAIAQSPTSVLGPNNSTTVASPLDNWQPRHEDSGVENVDADATTTSVRIEIRSVAVDLDCDVPLKSFFKRGSFEVHTSSMPSVDATANVGASRLSNAAASANSTTKKAAACESVRRASPVMLGKLDNDGLQKIIKALSSQKVVAAPTVVCYSGQTATVSDVNLRPFVVGVKPIVGDDAVAHQPVIQTIEDGYMFRLNPAIKGDKIDLNASLAHSKVSDVETFTISGSEDAGITVQIPEQTLKQVSLSTSLKDGETLFVDPRLQIEVEEAQTSKLPFKKSSKVTATKQLYFLVTARIEVPEEELGTSLTQVK
jgi:hypothetical protein